ncbi:NlpC/P60 family protein [Alloalcanivorax sp. C16-1]|uniref:NlpC/P60 family protein n=1 Tax=Alloalcanivorax sp. C16-1 TaxID=3390051 RepID=UPI003970C10D
MPGVLYPRSWRTVLTALVLAALLGGCATRSMDHGPRVEERSAGAEPPPLLRDDVPADAADAAPISPLLRAQAEQWRGVPYRLGGSDRQGIDCSAFVQVTFQSQLGIDVPRTTDELAREGRRVGRDELRAGDLVFFKTGFRQRHVGIYMGGDRFLHASTSRGVMTSSLNNVYWRRHYWKARRLDLDERPSAVSLSDESR